MNTYANKMADNSAPIHTSEIHNRPTVASDPIRDLLLGTQTVPPPENSFESRPVGDAARVSVGDQTMVERSASDSRGAAPPGGVGAAANSEEQPPPVEQPSLATPGMTEAMMKLATFWHDENVNISRMDANHEIWRNPEMPLARIKKIMRIDEDVKMISAEVPILFSKAASIFIRELTLRAWIQTEEAKRRTLQRSDIALAITKYDMFDFLIDIVPRDEIQVKPTRKQEENHPVLTPEQIQLLIQLSQSQQQQGQGQVASAAPQEEDDQQPPAQPSQALLTSPNKASLETLHQLLQLQYLQQQLNAATAQSHSTEPTDVHREPA